MHPGPSVPDWWKPVMELEQAQEEKKLREAMDWCEKCNATGDSSDPCQCVKEEEAKPQ